MKVTIRNRFGRHIILGAVAAMVAGCAQTEREKKSTSDVVITGDTSSSTDSTDATDGVIGTDVSDGTDATDVPDGVDATDGEADADATDAIDGTDSVDGTDQADSTDVVDSTDGADDSTDSTDSTDATDATDGTVASDTTDSTDATDGTDTSDSTDVTDGTDTTDATDATDGTDTTDTTDTTDATDGTDATDATDGTDTTDATDGTDTTDSTDGTDGTDGVCTPVCSGTDCKPDGCGGVCVCPGDQVCGQGGVCKAPPVTQCNPVLTLACGETKTFDTGSETSTDLYDLAFETGPCTIFGDSYDGPELTIRLELPPGTKATLSDDNDDIDLFLLEVPAGGVCEATLDTCVMAATSDLDFISSVTGQSLLMLDNWNDTADSTSVTLECCTPACTGKSCGDDGCGGQCGQCDTGDTCSPDGLCVSPSENAKLIINEIDYDQTGTDTAEFIEIVNVGPDAATLSRYRVELMDGASSIAKAYKTIQLGDAGVTLAAGGRLLIATTGFNAPANVPVISVAQGASGWLQNGPDGIRIVDDTDAVLDSVASEGATPGAGEGGSFTVPDTETGSLSRCDDLSDTDATSNDWKVTATKTPGLANSCGAPPPSFNASWAIFKAKCATCHTTGSSGMLQIGASSATTAYASSQQTAYSLTGSKGEASLARIKNGSMPQFKGCTGDPTLDAGKPACLTAAEQATIKAWLDGGQAGPTP